VLGMEDASLVQQYFWHRYSHERAASSISSKGISVSAISLYVEKRHLLFLK